MKQEIAKLVKFGQGGDTLYFGKGHTCSGYGSPESPHAAVSNESHLIPDGCPVLDLREAVQTEEGFRWVFRGPMVNVDLPDNERDVWCEESQALDFVSTSQYIGLWRQHGARVGQYINGQFVWE